MGSKHLRPTHAIINLDNLGHNFRQIRTIAPAPTKICAVVKANAYGHGAVEIAREALSSGVEYLAVALLDEALELRENGIDAPILILGFTPVDQFGKILAYDITQTIYDIDSAYALSVMAEESGKRAKVHIKIDTGMSRLGFQVDSPSIAQIERIFELKGIYIEGIFTHLAKAENDQALTKRQWERFQWVMDALERRGLSISIKHICNSAATLEKPSMHLDMVRTGIVQFGLLPSSDEKWKRYGLKPVMTLKSTICHIKSLASGRIIGYGGEFTTSKPSTIATVPVGYADGWRCGLSPGGSVLISGRRAPIVGRICMDQLMVDISDMKDTIGVGDEVVLMGEMGDDAIFAEEIAHIIGTINYEVVCSISQRVPRVYLKRGKK